MARRARAVQDPGVAAADMRSIQGGLPLFTLHLTREHSPGARLHLDVCFVELLPDRWLPHHCIPFVADAAASRETVRAFRGAQAGLAVKSKVLQVKPADRVPRCRA